ncbi:MAG: hypothetical protein IPH28_07565 [Cytophagaceae bacterium]|nr:hypothetical protein [Cytophagaceae bacterium]MBK9511123.1 hypothetical protein [Cytophagaceae bacterium]MBK9935253.1 hypothetical protein [Cytophagaceae bacterium]MBL0301696.1 hypothetical protein [Cytophagaceae bacterium]MBL0324519.1 hypothetical protein [Cytophagaceae bacterium]
MDKKTKVFSIVSTIIFFTIYFGRKHLAENMLVGKWATKSTVSETFSLNFMDNDSVVISKNSEKLSKKYLILENNRLVLENETDIKEYNYLIQNQKLFLIEKGDTLTFLRK